jgi:hypothetical protein
MKSALQVAVKVQDKSGSDRTVIEIDKSITRIAAIKDGTVFAEELTPEGHILLKRLEANP